MLSLTLQVCSTIKDNRKQNTTGFYNVYTIDVIAFSNRRQTIYNVIMYFRSLKLLL